MSSFLLYDKVLPYDKVLLYDINEEIAAFASEKFLYDTDAIKQFVKDNRTLAQKVLDVITEIIDKIKSLISDYQPRSREAKLLQQEQDIYEAARDLWYDALNKSDEHSVESETKMSFRSDFYAEYDKWNHKNPRIKFNIGTTSKSLLEIGVKESDIYMDSSKLIKIQHDHKEMTDDVIKKIPDIIQRPMLIMESKTVHGRITMFGEVVADGKPILAVLELNPSTANGIRIENVIKVASSYGKNNAQSFINKSNILWIYDKKNKTDSWMMRNRLQLPVGINHYGLINSISNNSENENTNQKKFSMKDSTGRTLTDNQYEYFKDSKVVDNNGNLLVMYHETPYGGFTVFKNDFNYFTLDINYADRYKNPSQSSNRGYYNVATNEKTYEVYLNIKNPFDISNTKERKIFVDYIKGGNASGINPYISDAEIEKIIKNGVDWVEADNLKEFLDEKSNLYIFCAGGYNQI